MNRSPVTGATALDPRRFVEELRSEFQEVARHLPLRVRRFRMAGLLLELRQAGGSDASFRAWEDIELREHVAEEPDLVLHAWDAAGTGRPYPTMPWTGEDAHLGRGEIAGFQGGDLSVTFCPGARVLTVLDPLQKEGWYWTPDFAKLPFYERAAPGRHALGPFLRARGRSMVHGAAVALDENRGLLLAGPGGSGKSCTSLSGLIPPLRFLGDDYTALEPGETPTVHQLYASAKVHPPQLSRLRLRGLETKDRADDDGKAVLFMRPAYPGQLLRHARLRAVVIPCVAGAARSRMEPLSKIQTLTALAPSSIFQLPGAGAAEFRQLSALVKSCETFRMILSPDPADVHGCLVEFLQRYGT